MLGNKRYKDKCEICNNFDYLKGFNSKCLCDKCISTYKDVKELKNKKKNFKQLSIYDVGC